MDRRRVKAAKLYPVFLPWSGSEDVLLGKKTWKEMKESIGGGVETALVPIGSTEEHGPAIPLDNDIFNSTQLCINAALRCENVVVAPPLCFGMSDELLRFSGTISLTPQTFIACVKDIARSLAGHGFRNIIFVTGHGGNITPMNLVIEELRRDLPNVLATLVSPWIFSSEYMKQHRESEPGALDDRMVMHACETESSLALALRPSEVREGQLVKEVNPILKERYSKSDPIIPGPSLRFGQFRRIMELSETGVVGDATKATREKGEKVFRLMIEGLVDLIRSLPTIRRIMKLD